MMPWKSPTYPNTLHCLFLGIGFLFWILLRYLLSLFMFPAFRKTSAIWSPSLIRFAPYSSSCSTISVLVHLDQARWVAGIPLFLSAASAVLRFAPPIRPCVVRFSFFLSTKPKELSPTNSSSSPPLKDRIFPSRLSASLLPPSSASLPVSLMRRS